MDEALDPKNGTSLRSGKGKQGVKIRKIRSLTPPHPKLIQYPLPLKSDNNAETIILRTV